MSILIDEKDLPVQLTTEQAVEAAYAAELAEVASKLQRGLPCLVECDKDLGPHLFANLRYRLKGAGLKCVYLDGRPRGDEANATPPSGLIGTMIGQEDLFNTHLLVIAGVVAGFEGDEDPRAACGFSGLGERDRLGMRPAAALRPAATDHRAVPDDDAADIGIGRRAAAAALAERDGRVHPAQRLAQMPTFFKSRPS